MIQRILRKIRRHLPDRVPLSYAQNGEDTFLFSILEPQETGFYVDVGAFEPRRFSNTYGFYLKGWHGLVVDAQPNFKASFNRVRPRDIAVECGVSDKEETLTYHTFEEGAMNTFEDEELDKMVNVHKCPPTATHRIHCKPLSAIIDQYAPKDIAIDLLSIDVEGMDFKVLQSLDWKRQAPKIVIIEDKGPIAETPDTLASKFLASQGYDLIFKNNRNAIYQKAK